MTEKQYRNQWIRWHSQYEKIAYKKLLKSLREMSNKIPFDYLTKENYNTLIRSSFKEEQFISTYYDFYKEVGIIHGKRVGKQINKQIKEFTVNSFLGVFERELLTWLYSNSLSRITSVQSSLVAYLQEFVADGVANNLTTREISRNLQNTINKRNFYRWQALRIVRTETTAAANYASTVAADSSGVLMDKVWISADDSRTRRPPKSGFNHLVMNGVKVGKDEQFKVPSNGGFQLLDFPGDPKGSAGNVINCRCNSALIPRRDENGRLVFT
jgi:hypothetical protein